MPGNDHSTGLPGHRPTMKHVIRLLFATIALVSCERLCACETTLAYLDKTIVHFQDYKWKALYWQINHYKFSNGSQPLISDYSQIGMEAARQDVINTDVGKILRDLKQKGIKPSEKIAQLIEQVKAYRKLMDYYIQITDPKNNYNLKLSDKTWENNEFIALNMEHERILGLEKETCLENCGEQWGADENIVGYILAKLHYIKCQETIVQLGCLAASQE